MGVSRIANHYVYYLWDKEGIIEYVGKGQGKRLYESAREKKSFGGTIFKRNLDNQTALSMEAALMEHYGLHTLRNKVLNGAEPMYLIKFPPRKHGTRLNHPMDYPPKICSQDHYQKYKETMKLQHQKQVRKRDLWINDYLANQFCLYCGESDVTALAFYPNNKEIRAFSKKTGLRKELRLRVLEAIRATVIVCLNCESKLDNGRELKIVSGATIDSMFPSV